MKKRAFIWTESHSGPFESVLHVAEDYAYPAAHIAEGRLVAHHVATVEYEDGSAVQPISRLDRFTSAAEGLGFHVCRCAQS